MSYFVIEDWMTKLKLNGLKRDVFAIILSYNQEKDTGSYYGSLNYLSKLLGRNKSYVHQVLLKLVKEKYLIKSDVIKNNVKYCDYQVNHDYIKNLLSSSSNSKDNTEGVLKNNTGCIENEYGCIENEYGCIENEYGCIENQYGGVLKMNTGCIENEYGGVLKINTKRTKREYKKNTEREKRETSHSKVSNTQNNSGSTPDTSELDLFSSELINIFREFTASEVSSLENVNALKDQAKRLEFLELFNNASGEWREAIKHAKKLVSKSNKIGTLKWLDFLDFLKLLLRNRTVDGVNFIKKRVSESDKLKLEKEKQERDKQEAMELEQIALERKLEASRLGISVDDLDNYIMTELRKKLSGQVFCNLDLDKDKEVYHA